MDLLVRLVREGLTGQGCCREDALALTGAAVPLSELLAQATRLREAHSGSRVALCGIVNARSGRCAEDCAFCAQAARHRTGVETYPLRECEALVAAAREAQGAGAHCFGIVTSGASVTAAELDEVAAAVTIITGQLGLQCSASLGALTPAQLARLKAAGLPCYHHNLETSERFFPQICTTHTWQSRVDTVRAARAAGLAVCCGGLFGLGETWEDRIDMLLACRTLGVQSVPLNFLHPVPGTPLADQPPLRPEAILRSIAIARFLLPDAVIRVCGGRDVNLGEAQEQIFAAGANGMMIGNYLTTAGRRLEDDHAMLERLGLAWR